MAQRLRSTRTCDEAGRENITKSRTEVRSPVDIHTQPHTTELNENRTHHTVGASGVLNLTLSTARKALHSASCHIVEGCSNTSVKPTASHRKPHGTPINRHFVSDTPQGGVVGAGRRATPSRSSHDSDDTTGAQGFDAWADVARAPREKIAGGFTSEADKKQKRMSIGHQRKFRSCAEKNHPCRLGLWCEVRASTHRPTETSTETKVVRRDCGKLI